MRGFRRLYERDNLRRDRLHRVLNIIGFLPQHYSESIDFDKNFGQFKEGKESKLNYRPIWDENSKKYKYEFLFKKSFNEMVDEFKKAQPNLFYIKKNGCETKIPHDWTIYYLRKKALSQKISKEELAWIILNFNQKRGYYQLRGEEDIDDTKNEEYYLLRVIDVNETKDKKAKGIWYEVKLENGWIYKRQSKESLESWVGSYKEFIVTTHTEKDKNGNIKRSFRAVDSEKDWIAIKKKTDQDIESSGKTVGEYIYENLLSSPKQKIRGKLIRTIERKFYKDELEKILKKQIEFHQELKNRGLYFDCVQELYPRNESHQNIIKNEGFGYLFIDDIIFYQRSLKSKKSTIANCAFEEYVYVKDGVKKKQALKAIAKSHPLFQQYRLLQWFNYLKIYEKERVVDGKLKINYDVTNELLPDINARTELFDFLQTKKEINQTQLLKYFSDLKIIAKQKKESPRYRWNYVEDKTYPCYETRADFVSRLKKVNNLDDPIKFLETVTRTSKSEEVPGLSREVQLWHVVYSVKDKKQYEKALSSFARKHSIDKDSFVTAFQKHPPFESAFGAFSEKAIKKLLPLMRFGKYWNEDDFDLNTKERINRIITGEYDESIQNRVREKAFHLKEIKDFYSLPQWLTSYIVYDRHSELGDVQKWSSPSDIDNYLKNIL